MSDEKLKDEDIGALIDVFTLLTSGMRELRELRDLRDRLATVEQERDAYRAMVCDLLASAHPHPTEHPTMTKQWARARELLKHGPTTLTDTGKEQ